MYSHIILLLTRLNNQQIFSKRYLWHKASLRCTTPCAFIILKITSFYIYPLSSNKFGSADTSSPICGLTTFATWPIIARRSFRTLAVNHFKIFRAREAMTLTFETHIKRRENNTQSMKCANDSRQQNFNKFKKINWCKKYLPVLRGLLPHIDRDSTPLLTVFKD